MMIHHAYYVPYVVCVACLVQIFLNFSVVRSAAMSSRTRYNGGHEVIADAFGRVAKHRRFLVYDSSPKVSSAKLDLDAIGRAHPLLAELHELDSGMNFCRNDIKKALRLLLWRKRDDRNFAVADDELEDYVEQMTNRVCNLVRVVKQGVVKGVAWTRQLPWLSDAADPPPPPVASQPEEVVSDAAEYMYGWDTEKKLAWRMKRVRLRSGKFKEQKELCVELREPADGDLNAPMQAAWASGEPWSVPEMTLKKWRDAKRPAANEPTYLWTGEHRVSKNRLTIRMRSDREPTPLLVSCYEQTNQVLQINPQKFVDTDTAVKFAIEVFAKYANDEIAREELIDTRNRMMAERLAAGTEDRAGAHGPEALDGEPVRACRPQWKHGTLERPKAKAKAMPKLDETEDSQKVIEQPPASALEAIIAYTLSDFSHLLHWPTV